MLNISYNLPTDFDLFVDEDVRSRRIGVLLLEKNLTPALTQALFRVRENSQAFIHDDLRKKYADEKEFKSDMSNNLSRCYRIDSRSHDLIQLCDLLLGVTTNQLIKKTTQSNAKLRVLDTLVRCSKQYTKKHSGTYQSIYLR